jgi:hypothetical protein
MYEIKYVKGEVPGRLGVVVPYSEPFHSELKTITAARFDAPRKAWCFDEEDKEEVIALLERFFVNTAWQRVTIEDIRAANITVDGASLLYVNRDRWSFRRDSGIKYKVVESSLGSGGSRANPIVHGRIVVDIDLRDGAIIRPEPTAVEPIAEQEPANPLAAYPPEMLKAELTRRGIKRHSTREVLEAMERALGEVIPGDQADYSDEVKQALKSFILATRRQADLLEGL